MPIGSDVIKFKIKSVEPLNKPNHRRSAEFSEYLVTFEISLEADKDLEVEDRLSNILSQIEDFEPESITVTDQKIHSEDGKLLFYFDSKLKY